MRSKLLLAASAMFFAVAGSVPMSAPAHAQDARQAELIGYHVACNAGDRKACIRFGMLLGEMRERHAEWRRLHPEFWWWEH
jgi:hypothetical protein